MPRDFMTLCRDACHRFGIALGDPAAGQKRRLHFLGGQKSQDPVNARLGTVFGLSIFLMIHLAVLVWPDILAALKVEAQENGDARIARPENFLLSVKFL